MDYIKNRNKFWMVSIIIILIGLGMFFIKGLNYGIDFTSGTLIEGNLGKFVDLDEIRELMDDYDKNASIIHSGNNKEEIIIKSTLEFSNNDTVEIIEAFSQKFGVNKNQFQFEKFEASMGKEIKNKALISMAISMLAMLVYITFRFEFYFGLSAIVALVHDILIMFAVYSIFRIPVDSSFIAAILIILGYSINDTIVIFDRIRENLKLKPRQDIKDTVNESINQSLRRTVSTSITTLLVVVAIYVLGVKSIRILALPLMVGILSGTYSSIFIASPLWYVLKNKNSIKTAS